jgi:hypothetical protein
MVSSSIDDRHRPYRAAPDDAEPERPTPEIFGDSATAARPSRLPGSSGVSQGNLRRDAKPTNFACGGMQTATTPRRPDSRSLPLRRQHDLFGAACGTLPRPPDGSKPADNPFSRQGRSLRSSDDDGQRSQSQSRMVLEGMYVDGHRMISTCGPRHDRPLGRTARRVLSDGGLTRPRLRGPSERLILVFLHDRITSDD